MIGRGRERSTCEVKRSIPRSNRILAPCCSPSLGVPEADVPVVRGAGEELLVHGVPRERGDLLGVAAEDRHLAQRAHVVQPDQLVAAARQQQMTARVPPHRQHRVLRAVPAGSHHSRPRVRSRAGTTTSNQSIGMP